MKPEIYQTLYFVLWVLVSGLSFCLGAGFAMFFCWAYKIDSIDKMKLFLEEQE
jgi:hypothetical protein